MDSYVAEESTNPSHTTIIFTLKEEAGALAETLKVFKVGFKRRIGVSILIAASFFKLT